MGGDRTLFDQLAEYAAGDMYPFHMPGHKRNMPQFEQLYRHDITEIDGFDSLHGASGILRSAQERAAALYRSSETYFLVNGATSGLLAAVGACCRPGERILIARNCHRSVYNAAIMHQLCVSFVYPRPLKTPGVYGGVAPEDVENALSDRGIRAVVITSPTYEGVISDVFRIAQICHAHNVPLIVDEAHGAHFGLAPECPASSVDAGADLTVHSVHKTLPALTQTALLHVNGSLVDRERVAYYVSAYLSTSPSYLLMASIDEAMNMVELEGGELFARLGHDLSEFSHEASGLRHLSLLNQTVNARERERCAVAGWDPGRLVFVSDKAGGKEIMEQLRREDHVELEMAGMRHAVAIATIRDTEEGFCRLLNGLQRLDGRIGERPDLPPVRAYASLFGRAADMTQELPCINVSAAVNAREKRRMSFDEADWRLACCAEFVYLYPPGIPLLAPGETISARVSEAVRECRAEGLFVEGLSDRSGKTVLTLP